MSWWDYGYQITGMANRTVLVDNNTWNNTHIANVGRIFASPEDEAAQLLRALDADYVLVMFGGLSYYPGDDINKFLWMIRIAAGVFPQVKEEDFLNKGEYRVDDQATNAMKNSLMYKLCYYRFGETPWGGYDYVRQAVVGDKAIKLRYFREVYTTAHWLLRIYKVLPQRNRDTLSPKSSYSHSEDLQTFNLTSPKDKNPYHKW